MDAAASGAMGLAFLTIAGPLSGLLGLPAVMLRWVGVVLLPFAAWLAHLGSRRTRGVDAVRIVVACNVAWVAASVVALLGGWLSPTAMGTSFIIAQAAVVAVFARLQGASIQTEGMRSNRGRSVFAVAHLRNVAMGPEIVEYVRRIDATLEPFGGRFLVHGGRTEPIEGSWSGDLVIIQFPDRERARGWYHSGEYQAILALRAKNSEGEVILVDTVAPSHRATDILGDSTPTGGATRRVSPSTR
jgi:uncharacterized protein (DUF1330 family)